MVGFNQRLGSDRIGAEWQAEVQLALGWGRVPLGPGPGTGGRGGSGEGRPGRVQPGALQLQQQRLDGIRQLRGGV